MPNLLPNIPFGALKFDRQSGLRDDDEYINQQLARSDTKFVIYSAARPLVHCDDGGNYSTIYINTEKMAQIITKAPQTKQIFVGLDGENCAVFVCELPKDFDHENFPLRLGGEFCELRGILMRTNNDDLALLGLGRSIFDWHARHGFCGNCGAPTNISKNGWSRKCNSCATEHFPRVDPVTIMLVTDGDNCLLGRSKNFPPGFFSLLAGFVEPGETIEEGCKREIFEETNINATDFEIIGSQPWPFPSQLMIGLFAKAQTKDIKIDPDELEDARWFSRDEARQLISKGGLEVNGIVSYGPRKVAIAYYLLKKWIDRA